MKVRKTHTHRIRTKPSLCLISSTSRSRQPSTYIWVNVFQDLLNGAVLFDQINGSFGADPLDGATVVTAQQDTQVYEL